MTCKAGSNPVRMVLHMTHNYPSIYLSDEAKPGRKIGERIRLIQRVRRQAGGNEKQCHSAHCGDGVRSLFTAKTGAGSL